MFNQLRNKRQSKQTNPKSLNDFRAGEYLTLEELAQVLKVKESWVYKQTRQRKIPHTKQGKYLRFQREAIEGWLVENTVELR